MILLKIILLPLFFVYTNPATGSESVIIANDEDFNTLETESVIIHHPPRLENVARQIARIYPDIRAELEHQLGLTVDFKPDLQLINDRRTFTKMTGSDLVVAVAIPRHQLMVIDYTRMIDNPFRLRATVKHELSHLLLHRHIDSDILPRWLDEGVSQWVTGGISELTTDPGWSVLENAAMRDNLLRFDELVSFPSGRSETMLAYQQSLSFIEYVVDVYGEHALIEILHEMRHNASVERAFATVLPHSLRQIEHNWSSDIQARVSLFTYISRNMFQILFLLGALLVIIAFIKKIIQRRQYDDDEDEFESLPPDER